MKKVFLLIVSCIFVFSAYSQDSEVEAVNKLTKAEQFMKDNSFIKEIEFYKETEQGIKMYAKLFVDLISGEKLAALEFHPSLLVKALSNGLAQPLGYLDMEQVDDLLLALETIQKEANDKGKKDKFTITYTAPGGVDILYVTDYPGQITPIVLLRRKYYSTDAYGRTTAMYSEAASILPIKGLPKFISSVREAQMIANQSLGE